MLPMIFICSERCHTKAIVVSSYKISSRLALLFNDIAVLLSIVYPASFSSNIVLLDKQMLPLKPSPSTPLMYNSFRYALLDDTKNKVQHKRISIMLFVRQYCKFVMRKSINKKNVDTKTLTSSFSSQGNLDIFSVPDETEKKCI